MKYIIIALLLLVAPAKAATCIAPDNGISDATPAIQSCISNGGTIYLPKTTTGIYNLNSGYNSLAVLYGSSPVKIICDTGVWLRPTSAITNTQSIIYFVGSLDTNQASTLAEGCSIGDPTYPNTVRYGNHGIVFDTTVIGSLFKQPNVTGIFIQPANLGKNSCLHLPPSGCAIYVNNSSSNLTGGTVWATFEKSRLYGGVFLWNAGDHIVLRDVVFPPDLSDTNASNLGLYANLIAGAGNLILDNVNSQALAGHVIIDNSTSTTLINPEFEQIGPSTQPNNTMVEFGASTLVTSGVVGSPKIIGGSIISSDCVNKPYLIAFDNSIGGKLDTQLGHNCTSYSHSLIWLGVQSQKTIIEASTWWEKNGNTITINSEKYNVGLGTGNALTVTTPIQ